VPQFVFFSKLKPGKTGSVSGPVSKVHFSRNFLRKPSSFARIFAFVVFRDCGAPMYGWRRHATLLVFHAFLGGELAASQTFTQCFTHDDCSDTHQFCAWTLCEDTVGGSYPCGTCKPCTECLCDTDSTDFRCPSDRCPTQPINGVRFLQGFFHNHSAIRQVPGYNCVRRLVVTGNIFSIMQLPVYALHPATTAILNESDSLSSICPSYTRTGVFKSSLDPINNTLKLDATISSEGAPPPPCT
jgi:hypothetical protein